MNTVDIVISSDTATVRLNGRVDSANAPIVEKEIGEKTVGAARVILDCENLEYISSAGLRIVLRLKKAFPDLSVVNVSSEVYEIFDMTGFTEMIDVQKAYRVLSVDGCEVIGQGANGKVYRIDGETIVKVYIDPDSLPDIKRERELARKAFVLGVPTAIPYDVVRVEEGYGSVFELLNAKSLAKILAEKPDKLEEVVDISVDLLKKIHSTSINDDAVPSMKQTVGGWVAFLKDYLPAADHEKLTALVAAVPHSDTLLHGDYHIKNVMMQNGEALLIDMDTLCYGDPIFEFASVFNAYVGFSDVDHDQVTRFLGIPYETAVKFWELTLEKYFDGKSPEEIRIIEARAKLIGFTRIMRREIRRDGLNREQGRLVIENAKRKISELLKTVDSLT